MTSLHADGDRMSTGPDGPLRAVGLAAVCLGVAALAAATFVLSYQGIRDAALQGGIQQRYARGYPLLIDAMLVIVLAAVLALRGAGLPSRMLAWLTLLVVLGAAAGADVLHATGRTLQHNTAVTTAAVLPFALVLVAFMLLLAMLRHARLRRLAGEHQASLVLAQPPAERHSLSQPAPAPAMPVREQPSWDAVSIVPGFSSQLVSAAVAGAAAGAAAVETESWVEAGTGHDVFEAELPEPVAERAAEAELAADAEPKADAELPAEAEPTAEASPVAAETEPTAKTEPRAETELRADAEPLTPKTEPTAKTEPPADSEPTAEAEDDDMPVFHRIRSSPEPPEG